MRLKAKSVLLLTLVMLVSCAAVQPDAHTDRGGWVIQRAFLQHHQNISKKIEVFWTKPGEPGPWPAILFIHGHQEQIKNGGEAFVRTGRLGVMASRGYVAAALSQPGYGNSDGPPDFCGPFTQEAVLVAIDFLRNQPFVNPNKVVLYGYSRGAIVASMVATKDPKLAAVVLGAGSTTFLAGIRLHYVALTRTSNERRGPQLKPLEPGLPYIMQTRLRFQFFCCTVLRMNAFRYSRQKLLLRNFKRMVSPSS